MSDTARFEGLMIRAETMRQIEPDKADYWKGYIRGLRRAHHGENFGTRAEHTQWSLMVTDPDTSRKQMGLGYLERLAALAKTGVL